MADLLQVGVIGLGPLWHKRYRPAMQALRSRFRVSALCDQIEQQAAREAKHLGCAAAAGPTELLEKPDVDAVLLLDPQWYRLWPLEVASRLGKPVFCCRFLDASEPNAGALCRQLRERRLPVVLELAHRVAPAIDRLRELLASGLGAPRLVTGETTEEQGEAVLLDLAADLIGAEPVSLFAAGAEPAGPGLALVVQFSDDRLVNITRYGASQVGGRLRLQVIAERGRATVEFPNRVHWTDAAGHHTDVLPLSRPLGQLFLERFHQVVRAGQPAASDLERAGRLLAWLRAAAQSRSEGRRLELVQEKDV